VTDNPLVQDRVTYGAWCSLGSTIVAELMGHEGFDWVCIDLQHGLGGDASLVPMLQSVKASGRPALVRVAANDASMIGKALDAGAVGVVVPLIGTRSDAERALAACRYPPHGQRSWGPVRAQLAASSYTAEWATRNIVCIPLVETTEAVDNLDGILSVDGVDIVLVGPSDLALSMGLSPRIGPIDGDHQDVLAEIATRCRDHGVLPGIYCGNAQAAVAYRDMGYRMLAAITDTTLIRGGSRAFLDEVRA
jgi:4-hydroxy-2-oxoheptanedioate aldolase